MNCLPLVLLSSVNLAAYGQLDECRSNEGLEARPVVREPHVDLFLNLETFLDNPSGQLVSEGMPGWVVQGRLTTLHSFPPVLLHPDVRAYFPEQNSGNEIGTQVKISCPVTPLLGPCPSQCEVIISVYHCLPCSTPTNGGWSGPMIMAGWTPGSCAPRFAFSSDRHEMVSYRNLIKSGETLTTPLTTRKLANFAIFVRRGALNCSEMIEEGPCRATGPECRWQDNQCLSNWCPLPGPGGKLSCFPCAI